MLNKSAWDLMVESEKDKPRKECSNMTFGIRWAAARIKELEIVCDRQKLEYLDLQESGKTCIMCNFLERTACAEIRIRAQKKCDELRIRITELEAQLKPKGAICDQCGKFSPIKHRGAVCFSCPGGIYR